MPDAVLVTGASGALGAATVDRLAELGWQVFAAARDVEGLRPQGGTRLVSPLCLDVGDEDSIARAKDELDERLDGSGLRALVNNAGIAIQGPLELLPPQALHRQFAINAIAPIAMAQAFLPLLRSAGGRIINVGGAAGTLALPMSGPLSASKAALASLSDVLRMELSGQGVAVSYVEPGALDTDFFAKASAAARKRGYVGDPETQQIYARAIDASEKSLTEMRTDPISVAVKTIVRAVVSDMPRARYRVGRDARLVVPLLRMLSPRVRDRILLSGLGLGRDVLGSGAPPAK